jgi:hypothetical protein
MLWGAHSGSQLSFLSTVKSSSHVLAARRTGSGLLLAEQILQGLRSPATSLLTVRVKNQSQNSAQNSEGRERPRHIL